MSVKLLKNLSFGDKINHAEPITESGKNMLNKYKAYIYSNPVSCSLVNNFVNEASQYTFDSGLNSILEAVNSYIKKNNISWKLASACESISNNNSKYNYINKLGVEQVREILEMDEPTIVNYIKAGALKNIQYIPEFRNICKEVYKTNITESKAINYTVTNPVSYVMLTEGNVKYFNVLGKTYCIKNGLVNECICNDQNFMKINNILENMFAQKGEDIVYEYKNPHGVKMSFTLNENGLTFKKEGTTINENFTKPEDFIEYADKLTLMMPTYEKLGFMQAVNNVNLVFENFDSVYSLDSVKLLNTSNGTVCAIIEGKDNVNLTVFQSYTAGKSSNNYDYVVEALNNVTKLTGIDLKYMFEDRINEDCEKQSDEASEIEEQLEANREAQFDIRKKKIAMLAEQYKNDPVRIALLNKIAKDLRILENKK